MFKRRHSCIIYDLHVISLSRFFWLVISVCYIQLETYFLCLILLYDLY
uniref:Uncharacterized protein n=1 Tax=Arundo donax TaxID=35708 RepID=A0A0A9CMK8_ARUDO